MRAEVCCLVMWIISDELASRNANVAEKAEMHRIVQAFLRYFSVYLSKSLKSDTFLNMNIPLSGFLL